MVSLAHKERMLRHLEQQEIRATDILVLLHREVARKSNLDADKALMAAAANEIERLRRALNREIKHRVALLNVKP